MHTWKFVTLVPVLVGVAAPRAEAAVEWTSLGLRGRSLMSVAVSPAWPADPTLFAGDAFDRQVHSSTDGGTNWVSGEQFGSVGTHNIAEFIPSPEYRTGSIDETLFLSGALPGGINHSVNGGVTWKSGSLNGNPGVATTWGLAVSPEFSTDRTVFASSNAGFLRSTDGGENFTASNAGLPYTNTYCIAVSGRLAVDNTIFVGMTGSGVGIYRSTNRGDSWQEAGNGLPITGGDNGPSIDSMSVSSDLARDPTLFATVEGSGVFRSRDKGDSWQQVLPFGFHDRTIVTSPDFANDQTVIVADILGRVRMSTNGGDTWATLTNLPFGAWEIKLSPNFTNDHMLFAATTDGVWVGAVPEPAATAIASSAYVILMIRLRSNRLRR